MLFSIIKLIIIFIIGFYIGYFTGNKLFDDINTVYKGPDSNHIKKKVFGYNDKCYTFETEICFCPRKKGTQVPFEPPVLMELFYKGFCETCL